MDKPDFLDIVDIVGQYVTLAPEGDSHFIGKCPFCAAAEDSLIVSVDNQYWSCLSCGADGDRYDFVARSENISRAEAILLIGHHTNSGEPFPHARFKPGAPAAKAAARKPERAAAPPPPRPAPPQAAPAAPAAQPAATAGGADQALLASFGELRKIIASYQGAALLDAQAKMIACDSESPQSAALADVGESLAPLLAQAATLFSKWGMGATLPAHVTLASEELAILVYQFGPPDKARLLVVRLANPSEVAVARRLVASASARIT